MSIYTIPENINTSALLVELVELIRDNGHTINYDGNSPLPPTEIEILPDLTAPQETALLAIFDKYKAESDALSGYSVLPDWVKTVSADDAALYVHDNVLNGLDQAGIDALVDALPNTVAGIKTGLKQIGGQLVAIRDILEFVVKLLMYIRDLIIKYRK